MADERHAHDLYFHPQRGWGPDPDDAQFRLEARWQATASVEAYNRIRPADGNGGWGPPLESVAALTPEQRGLVWLAWPTVAGGEPYFAFKGVRVIDKPAAETLFAGLRLVDEHGSPFASALQAGYVFLLGKKDAQLFTQRVRDAGGKIEPSQPLPGTAQTALTALQAATAKLEQLTEADTETLAAARSGNFTEQGDFERRFRDFRDSLTQATKAFTDCQRACAPLRLPGRGTEERAGAEAVLEEAQVAMTRAKTLMERRETDERDLARILATAQGKLRANPVDATAELLLWHELARVASDGGHEIQQTADGVQVATEHGWLHLPSFEFTPLKK